MNDPLLSVIIPVYNTEKYFKRCIDSVNSQTYRNIEIVVVNDGSRGNIGKIVPKQKNLKYIEHESNLGLFKARITGYENSSGDYVCFLDSDDYVTPDFYRSLVHEATEGSLDIAAGDTVFEKADGSRYKRNQHESNFGNAALHGDAVRKAFFSQEMTCFVWHTVWNKIYKRELWEKCIETFRKIDRRLVMTEDILFSSILFYNAKSFFYVPNEGYCYCENSESSTESSSRRYDKFEANISDIKFVFDFLDGYMREYGADSETIEDVRKGRGYYSRIWREQGNYRYGHTSKSERCKAATDGLMEGYDGVADINDHFFDLMKLNYNPLAEEIKDRIINERCKVVSFDIFDTLIVRPFYNPSDIFLLMDGKCNGFERFSKIRTKAENDLRSEWHASHDGSEDFSIDDIYAYIKKKHLASDDDADRYRKMELSYEMKYCFVRRFAKDLFELAKYLGKRIVLVSDMYLRADFVDEMLKKNGYTGYEKLFISSEEGCLKYNGKLFDKMISYVGVEPQNIIHIGDDIDRDYLQSKNKGMQPILLPKITDAFRDKAYADEKKKLDPNYTYSPYAKSNVVENSPAFRTMMSLVGMRIFDNPFVPYGSESDYNASADMIGYYPVGMHLMGICKWIDNIVSMSGKKHISFLSRDGYLVKKAYEIYTENDVKTDYVSCSRRCLLPWMVDGVSDLCSLPVNIAAHTPRSICSILEFCLVIPPDIILQDDVPFESEEDYRKKMYGIFEQCFSEDKLNDAKRLVREYYTSIIEEDSFVFDMGYSGCNPAALTRALGYHVNFLYIYKDESSSCYYEGCFNFDIQTMYDFSPGISGIIREYLLSENTGSCTGFVTDKGKITPVFETAEDSVIKSYAIRNIQKSALEFVRDYCSIFNGEGVLFKYNPTVVSIPFEYMLINIKDFDCRLFRCSYSDDIVYSNSDEIPIYYRWSQMLSEYYGVVLDKKRTMVTIDSEGIHDVIIFKSFMSKLYRSAKATKGVLKSGKNNNK